MKNRLTSWCAGLGIAVALSGCGGSGGGGSSSVTSGKSTKPTSTTRSRVAALFGGSVRSLTQAGFQTAHVASSVNASAAPLATGSGAGATATSAATNSGNGVPLIAAFLRNNQNAAISRARKISRARIGRDTVVSEPPVPDPTPVQPATGFYFDYYLGLWVATNDSAGQSTYLLYIDEAKIEPAGSIVTVWPADYTVYPQTYNSTYSFTAGYLAGSSGTSNSVYNADGSGQSTYTDTYSDGSSDSGTSVQTATGDSTWTSRTTAADASWTTFRGTFRSDGSGGTHTEMSDGYIADYVFNADGSGRGKITGPDPGLPVTITWDAYGDTTITYADGSTDYYPGWSSIGTPTPVGTGVATPGATSGSSGSSGSSSGNTGTVVASPPTPPATGI